MSAAFRWRKAVFLSLLSAIFLLNLLPFLGSTWHRVLPEHLHVFIGPVAENVDEPQETPRSAGLDQTCVNCAETRLEPGVVHLAAGIALQLFALAIGIVPVFAPVADFGRARRVLSLACLYVPPCLALRDPPPTPF